MAASFDTVYPADSLEFCPNENATDIFVCGTYKLVDSPPPEAGSELAKCKRKGQCLVFRMTGISEPSFDHIQTLDFPAIPDMKWCHGKSLEFPTLAIADSEGSVTLCEWKANEGLQRLSSTRCADVDILCLSLDWNNRITGSAQLGALAVSLSNGSLCYLQPDDTGSLQIAQTWHAHDYEPWIVAWDYHDTNLLLSGGDDLKLKLWDVRTGFGQPVLVNKKFEAGVTCIQSHPHISNLVAVGSYDEKVRFFDTRNLLRPITELFVGGGVWRVKWHPSPERKKDLLVACMHDGFKVVQFSQSDGLEPSIVKEFREHESLAYGADWSFSRETRHGESLAASCSFYDHELHVWSA